MLVDLHSLLFLVDDAEWARILPYLCLGFILANGSLMLTSLICLLLQESLSATYLGILTENNVPSSMEIFGLPIHQLVDIRFSPFFAYTAAMDIHSQVLVWLTF